jgi:hypothetical protein
MTSFMTPVLGKIHSQSAQGELQGAAQGVDRAVDSFVVQKASTSELTPLESSCRGYFARRGSRVIIYSLKLHPILIWLLGRVHPLQPPAGFSLPRCVMSCMIRSDEPSW